MQKFPDTMRNLTGTLRSPMGMLRNRAFKESCERRIYAN